MSVTLIHMWAEPKAGHEVQYRLAWKRRVFYEHWARKLSRNPLLMFRVNRLWDRWGEAVDAIKEHGQNVEEHFP